MRDDAVLGRALPLDRGLVQKWLHSDAVAGPGSGVRTYDPLLDNPGSATAERFWRSSCVLMSSSASSAWILQHNVQ